MVTVYRFECVNTWGNPWQALIPAESYEEAIHILKRRHPVWEICCAERWKQTKALRAPRFAPLGDENDSGAFVLEDDLVLSCSRFRDLLEAKLLPHALDEESGFDGTDSIRELHLKGRAC
jgi:hypothetical protein